jgi:hypothetical protein
MNIYTQPVSELQDLVEKPAERRICARNVNDFSGLARIIACAQKVGRRLGSLDAHHQIGSGAPRRPTLTLSVLNRRCAPYTGCVTTPYGSLRG